MTVLSEVNRIRYTAAGGQTTFAYPFKIFESGDLDVYVNGLLQSGGYTVTNVGVDGGGNVVFVVGRTVNDIVLIRRKLDLFQATDYPEGGNKFPAKAHEDALDRGVMIDQQLGEEIGRSVKFPVITEYRDIDFPTPAAGQTIRWNLVGNGLENVPLNTDALGTFLQSGAGAVARSLASKLGEWISVKDFGATGDGVTDDTAAIQAAINAAKGSDANIAGKSYQTMVGGKVYFPKGRYLVSSQIAINSWGVFFIGEGLASTIHVASGGSFPNGAVFYFNNGVNYISNVGVVGLALYGNDQSVGLAKFEKCRDNVLMRGCYQRYANAPIAYMKACDEWLIDEIKWIPFVSGPTANGVTVDTCNEGEIRNSKLFGWDINGADKTSGWMIYATQSDELRVRGVDGAFFTGGGIRLDRCHAFLIDKFQAETCTKGILVTSDAGAPAATDNTYGSIRDTIYDAAPIEIEYGTGILIDQLGSGSGAGPAITLGAGADKCQVRLVGGRGSTIADNGTNNSILTDVAGRLETNKGYRVLAGGVFEAVTSGTLRSVNSGTSAVESSIVMNNTGVHLGGGTGINKLNWGAASSITDGATIAHGLGSTPTAVLVLGSAAGEMLAVTAKSSTTFTVAIKKHDGSAGTSQSVYWIAIQ
jgi:hypothetical protein